MLVFPLMGREKWKEKQKKRKEKIKEAAGKFAIWTVDSV